MTRTSNMCFIVQSDQTYKRQLYCISKRESNPPYIPILQFTTPFIIIKHFLTEYHTACMFAHVKTLLHRQLSSELKHCWTLCRDHSQFMEIFTICPTKHYTSVIKKIWFILACLSSDANTRWGGLRSTYTIDRRNCAILCRQPGWDRTKMRILDI